MSSTTENTTVKRRNNSNDWDIINPITVGQAVFGSGTNASTPIVNSSDQIDPAFLSNYVDKSSAQTIAGTKTFTTRPKSAEVYTKLSYISSPAGSGFPYIRTGVLRGIHYTNKLTCVLDGYFSESQTYGFCGYDSGGQIGQKSGKWSTENDGLGTTNVNCIGSSNRATVTQVLDFSNSTNKLYISGTMVAGRSINNTSYSQTNDYPIFVAYSGTYTYNPAKLVLYSFKMYDGDTTGTLIRDFIPVRTANDEIGLLDLVENKFYRNQGTTAFTAGSDVETITVAGDLLVSSDVSLVGLTNDYNDLDNKPTIPTTYVSTVNGNSGDITGIATTSDLSSYVPTSRTVNSKALSSNITLSASDVSAVEKTTYEYNKEISFGSSGYLKIGSFPMYDSNITIDIDSTTSTTYHGTIIIATQNVSTSSIGSAHVVSVYGDASDTITSAIRVTWASGSRNYNVFFVPSAWSKNLVHIRAMGLNSAPSDICVSQEGTAPTSTSGLEATNVLKSNFVTSVNGSSGAVTINIPTNYVTTNGNQAGLSGNKTTTGTYTFDDPSDNGTQATVKYDLIKVDNRASQLTGELNATGLSFFDSTYSSSNAVTLYGNNSITHQGANLSLPTTSGTLALTSDIQSTSVAVVTASGSSQQLARNTYYDFGDRGTSSGETVTITLGSATSGVVNEYMGEILVDEYPITLSTPSSITWAESDGVTNTSNALTLEEKYTYQFNIIRNLGLIVRFPNGVLAKPNPSISGSTISWSAITNATNYKVVSGNNSVTTTSTSYALSGWYYTLGTLSTPTNLTATAGSGSSYTITLTWDSVAHANTYTVYYKTSSASSYSSTSVSTNTATLTSLSGGTTYNLYVRANGVSATAGVTVTAQSTHYVNTTSDSKLYTYTKYNASSNSSTVNCTTLSGG